MIELLDVCKSFQAGTWALRGVTLQIASGETTLVTGPSGAGKTTLLRTIFAAERPDSGRVWVAGREVGRLRRSAIPYLRRNVGVVFQDFKLLCQRTALDNVSIALDIQGCSAAMARRAALQALAAVGLADKARAPVARLSGGEQQRVAIARAIVGSPCVLLADEPTGNLDPRLTRELVELLNQVAGLGATVVVASHDPMMISLLKAKRIVRLEAGLVASDRAISTEATSSQRWTYSTGITESADTPNDPGLGPFWLTPAVHESC